ncbi:glutaminase A [uncultured Maricaulis sp.]|jgi:glutaminase|uniref:glutaminase A n=1 Tax=uncultured Maricaulis sp. TaxID=174710 RepID=UPI0025F4D1ED|nr:glutaminase A [uncultured Maricaulis sp.]
MTASGNDPFARFIARPARFEQDAADRDSRLELAQAVCRAGRAAGCEDGASLIDHLALAGLVPEALPRLASLADLAAGPLDADSLASGLTSDALNLVHNALENRLAIGSFGQFSSRLANIFAYARDADGGHLADYIPELAKQDPDAFGMAACTIDGQQMAIGDARTAFCQQSVIKPLIYAFAMALNGENQVHRHVGREPSGRRFNELALDADNRPHNPMINSGAIMCASMIRPHLPVTERAELLKRFVSSAAGGAGAEIDQAVYESERATARRNLSLVKLMDEHDAFPEESSPGEALDLYFRACAIRMDCRHLAVVAGTLANGGVCPTTGHRVIDSQIVRNTLSLMLTCGMYDYSGEYAFTVGLPAKSGVSGGLMIVVPGVGGFSLWSPRLDRQGNPVRGIEVSKRLVEAFPFHIFSGVTRA